MPPRIIINAIPLEIGLRVIDVRASCVIDIIARVGRILFTDVFGVLIFGTSIYKYSRSIIIALGRDYKINIFIDADLSSII